MNYVSWQDLHRDIGEFSAQWVGKIDGIVGIPRSGCLLANLLGLHMNLPVSDVDSFVKLCSFWSHGPRMKANSPSPTKGGRILLMDDSALSGKSIQDACARMAGAATKPFKFNNYEVTPAVMYTQSGAKAIHHHKIINGPRIFAWNWNNHGLNKDAIWDFDGIVCRDPTVAEDDEVGYIRAIKEAVPLYLPTWPIKAICTHRLSKRKTITEAWMAKYGVTVGQMIMRPEATCHERRANKQAGEWKAKVYKNSDASLFVESCPRQADKIYCLSQKPVLCPIMDKMLK